MKEQPSYKTPFEVSLEAGKSYYWCACGKSANQPFCDSSHKGSSFVPLKFTAKATESVKLCGCKKTANPPYCDGSHKKL